MKTLSITDYKLVSPTLAKVVLSWTGDINGREDLQEMVQSKFENKVSPVLGSFRKVGATCAVGYVTANREVRSVDTKELRSNYKVIATNMMMDKDDESLWAVQSGGAAGTFLTRHGNEDLSELIQAATINHRVDIPKIANLTVAKAEKHELAAFVTKSGNIDYGFVIRTAGQQTEVVSKNTNTRQVIDDNQIVSLTAFKVSRDIHQQVLSKIEAADKGKAAAYWRNLFSYAPSFAEELVDAVEQGSVL